MPSDIRRPQPERGRADEPDEANANSREKPLSQYAIISDLPSPFVVAWLPRVVASLRPDARVLDLAMGRGRHARLLARTGRHTFGVDVKLDAVASAVATLRAEGLVVRGWCADLTVSDLPRDAFDLVLVTRYLQRDLFESIRAALRPGGIVMYETFTTRQRRHGTGPRSPEHLLEPGELPGYFEGFELLCSEEVEAPEAVARIVAKKGAV